MPGPDPSSASRDPPTAPAPTADRYPGVPQVLAAGALLTAAVAASYLWLDRPLAWFVHDQGFRRYAWLHTLTLLPDGLAALASLVLLLTPLRLGLRRAVTRPERTLFLMSLSLSLAQTLKITLKILFGRAWPETWINNNPSLIHDHVYGFFGFSLNHGLQSFPSGHSSLSFAAMSVLWLAAPRWRWPAAALCAAVVVGLLGMDYHFAGDILAGAALGSACGLYVWRAWGRRHDTP